MKAHRFAALLVMALAGAAPLAAQGVDQMPVTLGEVEQRPEQMPNTCQQPEYPARLRAARMEGRVVLQFVVDTLGRVEPTSIRAVQSTFSGFDESARRAISACRYRPARMNNQAVRVVVQAPVVFRLQRG